MLIQTKFHTKKKFYKIQNLRQFFFLFSIFLHYFQHWNKTMISIYNSVDCASWEIKNRRKKPRVKIERTNERWKIYKTSHGLMNLGYRRAKWERESTEESTWRLSKDRKSNITRFQIKNLKKLCSKYLKMRRRKVFISSYFFASNLIYTSSSAVRLFIHIILFLFT
jgi:hypothetical protein